MPEPDGPGAGVIPPAQSPHADGRVPETAPPVRVSGPRRRLLVVTNDFPPRLGGIQSFVHSALAGLPPAEVLVYTCGQRGAAEFDARQPYPVIRDRRPMLLPEPAVRTRVTRALQEHGATAVWFGAAAPLGLLAPALRRAGAQRLVATTHGHEVGWAALPGARRLLARIGAEVDVVTYLGEYTRQRLAAVLGPAVDLRRLAPGVDVDAFSPSADGDPVRRRYGLLDVPTVVCVSRLVPRKGQDALIDAWSRVRLDVPDARLLLVGRGPYEKALRRRADRRGVGEHVIFTGAVPATELAGHIAAGDVFAMPCRTRRGGLDVEGLGIVYLEAGACARPVVAGRSGGAPDAVLDGSTGYVVDGRSTDAIADILLTLLRDAALRARLGAAGRTWVERDWRWSQVSADLDHLLQS